MNASEELRNLIESDQFVTVRWFSATLKLSVEESKRVFQEFKNDGGASVAATYCISGFVDDSKYVISIVPEGSLEEKKSTYRDIDSVDVYSLQKSNLLDSASIYNQLQAVDGQLANEQLANPGASDSLILNTIGAIKLDSLVMKPVGQRVVQQVQRSSSSNSSASSSNSSKPSASVPAAKASASALSAPSSKAPVAALANNFFAKVATKSAASTAAKSTVQTKPTPTDAASTTSAPTTDTATDTAIAIATNATRSTTARTATKTVEATAATAEAEPSASAKDDGDDEEDEWDDGGGYKPNKANLINRDADAAASVIPANIDIDASASAANTTSVEDEEEEGGADSKGKKSSKKNVAAVHGAMDSYFEDVAIERFKADQVAGVVVGDAGQTTKKKRKLVEKMFSDAKGYLITEMVWEEVSDDEATTGADTAPTSSSVSTAAAKPQSKQAPADSSSAANKKAKKAAAPAPSTTTQKNMMSFFSKK